MELQKQGSMYFCSVSKKKIYDIWVTKNGNLSEKKFHTFNAIMGNISAAQKENLNFNCFESRIYYICERLNTMLKECRYNKKFLCQKYSEWLNSVEKIPCPSEETIPATTSMDSGKRGRPRKIISECGIRTKQRRICEVSKFDESIGDCIREHSVSKKDFSPVDTKEILSLVTEIKLTKHQYLSLRDFVNTKLSAPVFPSYNNLLLAKKECYPNNISITENIAEIELQSLLDHTANRLVESQKELFSQIPRTSLDSLVLIGKWGFDGSSGHSEYKQSFSDDKSKDDSLFVTSYVPLRLVNSTNNQVIWKNPRPSSTRYCRPIRIQFKKETTSVSVEEERYFKDKIASLSSTIININGENRSICHSLQLTMVDGKVCSALSDTSSSRCYICDAKPSEMNDIDKCLEKPVHTERFEFGLSTLHAWIRFFEYFIHVSYRLEVQKWQIRSKEEKEILSRNKKKIQSEFRVKLGLIIDQPKAGGSGTSNDGNTARKFFENSDISAEITGLDKCLIDRCATILKTMSSGYGIDAAKFRDFTLVTGRQLVSTYPWYNLPASVHKILIHGSDVIENALLPIGELSEEAAEAKNKDIKSFRLNHTRKTSRIATNEDLINRLLLSSDPYITGLRKLPQKNNTTLSKDVLALLSAT